MDFVFVLKVIWALAVVAILMLGLVYVARSVQRGRLVAGTTGRRLVTVVESTLLAQHTTVHVVKIADRYYLVGGGSSGVSLISELPGDQIEPFIDQQKAALAQQRAALMRPFSRFWKS